jgi:arylsulfatase A-like enzyme
MALLALPLLAALGAPPAPHVVVIGIDGLRAAALDEQPLPSINALRARGASTLHGRGVLPTVSSPNWASMIMGAGPEQHGVTSNDWQPDKFDFPPACTGSSGIFPTIFGLLRARRPQSVIGVFYDWDGFGRLVERSAPNASIHGDGPADTMQKAVAFVEAIRPDLVFVQLDHVDHAGHESGYTSSEYAAAVREADRLIGQMTQALARGGILDETVVLVTSDHGGVGTKHGNPTLTELEIVWIIAGPGIARHRSIAAPVNTVDTAATLARLLALTPPSCWTGRPVEGAFHGR